MINLSLIFYHFSYIFRFLLLHLVLCRNAQNWIPYIFWSFHVSLLNFPYFLFLQDIWRLFNWMYSLKCIAYFFLFNVSCLLFILKNVSCLPSHLYRQFWVDTFPWSENKLWTSAFTSMFWKSNFLITQKIIFIFSYKLSHKKHKQQPCDNLLCVQHSVYSAPLGRFFFWPMHEFCVLLSPLGRSWFRHKKSYDWESLTKCFSDTIGSVMHIPSIIIYISTANSRHHI